MWRWYQFVPDQYSVPHLRFWTVQPDSRIFSFPKYNVWDAVPLFVALFHETVLGVDLHSLHTPCALLAQRFQTCLHYTHNSLQLPVAHFVRLNSVLQLLPACLMVARIFFTASKFALVTFLNHTDDWFPTRFRETLQRETHACVPGQRKTHTLERRISSNLIEQRIWLS